jgi:hypothetical protein
VVHREVCSEKKAAWANRIFCIRYTDGTTLELRARPAAPRERVDIKLGYKALIEDCYLKNVRAVADL